jgi:hypothetical protein
MTSLAARSWQILIKIAKHLEILVKGVGPVVAALWIGWQYQQSRVDKRVESTLAYVTRYEGDDTLIGKTQRAIDAALWEHQDEIAEFRKTRADQEQIQVIQRKIALRVLKTASERIGGTTPVGPMEQIDDFFNALATCVQGAVCDEGAARRYFSCIVSQYLNSFQPVIKERTEMAPGFGWGLRWISEDAPPSGRCRQ